MSVRCMSRHIQQMIWVQSDDDASQRNKIKEESV